MSHNKGQSRGTINHCTRFDYNLIIIKVFNYGVNTTYNVPYATQAVKVWILINQKTKENFCQQNTTNKQTNTSCKILQQYRIHVKMHTPSREWKILYLSTNQQ